MTLKGAKVEVRRLTSLLRAMLQTAGAVLAAPYRFVRWLAEWIRWWGRSSRRRVMVLICVTILALAALGTRTNRLDLRYEASALARAHEVQTFYLPPHHVLRFMALGHESFLSDLIFIRANIYFVSELLTGERIFEWLELYADAVRSLDPYNLQFYEWASQAVKYEQSISNEAIERSNAYAQMGIDRFPDYWRFYFDIGFNFFQEWQTDDPEERRQLRQKSLPYFDMAMMLGGEHMAASFLSGLYLEEDNVEMALFHTYLRYWEADEEEKEGLRGRIMRYESLAAAKHLEVMDARWKGQFDYLPVELFGLLDTEPAPHVLPEGWGDTLASQSRL
jgi:hypothetical protein